MKSPIMLRSTHEDLILDSECELVCAKKKLQYQEETNANLRRLVTLLLADNRKLQDKYQDTLYAKDRQAIDLIRCEQELKELKLRMGSIEARWGKEASI